MSKFHTTSLCSAMSSTLLSSALALLLVVGLSPAAYAADEDTAAIESKLEEAQRLLDADLANQKATEAKRQAIEDRLAAQKQREQEILAELKQLCEEQDKLTPGTLDDCMAKLNN